MAKLRIVVADFEMDAEGSEDAIRAAFQIAGMLMRGEVPEDKPPVTGKPKKRLGETKKAHPND